MQIVNSKEDYDRLETEEKEKFKEYVQRSALKVRVEGEGEERTFTAYVDSTLLDKLGIEPIGFSAEEREELENKTRELYENQEEDEKESLEN